MAILFVVVLTEGGDIPVLDNHVTNLTVDSSDQGSVRGVCRLLRQDWTFLYKVPRPLQVLADREAEMAFFLSSQMGQSMSILGAVPSLASIHRNIALAVSYFLLP